MTEKKQKAHSTRQAESESENEVDDEMIYEPVLRIWIWDGTNMQKLSDAKWIREDGNVVGKGYMAIFELLKGMDKQLMAKIDLQKGDLIRCVGGSSCSDKRNYVWTFVQKVSAAERFAGKTTL
jgi:hypothetical protein